MGGRLLAGVTGSVGEGTSLGIELGSRGGDGIEVPPMGGTSGVANDCSDDRAVGLAVLQAVNIKITANNGRMDLLNDDIEISF
ncbi:MAG: hypothetical protein A2030_08105 [Chloroflexi bacterium RBG_19FT_COMBO_50_10]|nr:MAG: hypothetical protein A2030_08105 [Chloroflexi bacterium RBG_19FT_COMBO_50_10]